MDVAQLRQLHLEFARPGHGVLGENIQNKLGTVNNLALGDVGQVVQLGGRKFAVKNQHARAALQGQHFQFRHLALAQNQSGIDLGHALEPYALHGEGDGAGQLGQFVQIALLQNSGLGRHGNEQGARRVRRFPRILAAPGQLFFQGFGRGRELRGRAVPGLWGVQVVGLARSARKAAGARPATTRDRLWDSR